MAFIRHYSSDELSRSLHSATDKLGIEDFRAEQIDALKAFLRAWASNPRDLVAYSARAGNAQLRGMDTTS